jgi:hypothetical protein
VNPNDTGHIKKHGAHLNLEETQGGKLVGQDGNHTPIDKSTVRDTDFC